MLKPVFAHALFAILALPLLSVFHGGGYVPPPPPAPLPGGITPPQSPPGLSGSGPKTPAPSGPSTPGPVRAGPGPSRPRTPAGGQTPAAPAGPPRLQNSPHTPGADANGTDLSLWQHWWAFNQAPYLKLKSHIHSGGVATGSDEYWLGKGLGAHDSQRLSAETIRQVIIPQLLEALRKETSNDIQSSCMIALAKIGDPDADKGGSALYREVLLEIRKQLTSSSQELSETAAVSLGISASRENIPLLTALLENNLAQLRSLGVPQIDDVSVRTRAFAAYGLGLIGHGAAEYDRLVINASLRKLLDGECKSMGQRDIPVACLTAIGLTALAIDEHDLEIESSKKIQTRGVMTSRQDQLRFLLGYCADESANSLTRAQVPTALGRLLCGADIPADFAYRKMVAETLMHDFDLDSKADNAMQQSCILALGVLGDSDEDPLDVSIRATLMKVKERLADQQSRHFALIALAQAAGNPGRGQGDPIYGVNALGSGDNARTFLLAQLIREKGDGRPWAGLALAILERSLADAKQAPSVGALYTLRLALLDAKTPDDVGAFAIACGLVKDAEAKTVLLANLANVRDVEARGYTAVALGLIGESTAIAPLEEIAKQSKYRGDLLRSAAIALGLLDDKQVVPDLIAMLSEASSLSSQAAISSALGMIGDSRSVTALLDLLHSSEATELARSFGAVALGIVGDKEDLPWNSKIGVNSNYRANTLSLTDGKGGVLDIL